MRQFLGAIFAIEQVLFAIDLFNHQNQKKMKKIATLLLSLAFFAFTANADDRPIDYEQLPSAAKSFIKADFPTESISYITSDMDLLDTAYDVHFANGLKIEFNSKGEWTEISCTSSPIDSKYIPRQIIDTVATRWPGEKFKKIERHWHGYEVELTNRLELKFDKKFRLTEIDD